MKDNKLILGFILLVGTLLSACNQQIIYENNHDFVDEIWAKDSALNFSVDITDTNTICNIFFNTRISGQYPYSNMFLFIDTYFPNDIKTRDTLECILADPAGKWLGKGFGSIWSNKIIYRQYIKFPYAGTYTFNIEQAMRTDELPYVLDAGISIEKASR